MRTDMSGNDEKVYCFFRQSKCSTLFLPCFRLFSVLLPDVLSLPPHFGKHDLLRLQQPHAPQGLLESLVVEKNRKWQQLWQHEREQRKSNTATPLPKELNHDDDDDEEEMILLLLLLTTAIFAFLQRFFPSRAVGPLWNFCRAAVNAAGHGEFPGAFWVEQNRWPGLPITWPWGQNVWKRTYYKNNKI